MTRNPIKPVAPVSYCAERLVPPELGSSGVDWSLRLWLRRSKLSREKTRGKKYLQELGRRPFYLEVAVWVELGV